MKTLTQELVLLFYDIPQVFLGSDRVGCRYVCMIGKDDSEKGPVYACVPVSATRAEHLARGRIDLRTAFEFPEIAEFYFANFIPEEANGLTMLPANFSSFPANSLPDAGLTFDECDEVSQSALELNTTVSFVSLEVPEALTSARIRSETLGGFLFIFQAIVRNLSRAAARVSRKPLKRDDDSYAADVFGFGMGSFQIKFRSAYASDLNGESPTFTAAMSQLDRFLQLSSDPGAAVEYLQTIKGHAAASLIKMLGFLAEHSAGIHVEWANPSMRTAHKSRLDLSEIVRLFEVCRQRTDLTIQDVIIRGRVDLAADQAGNWKLISSEGAEHYSGEILPGSNISLSGMIITNAVYEFTCEERAEVVPATGREIKRLLLKSYKKLSD